MLSQRTQTAFIAVPLIALFVYLGGPAYYVGMLCVAGLAIYELFTLLRRGQQYPNLLILAALVLGLVSFPYFGWTQLDRPWIALMIVLCFAWELWLPAERRSLTGWALTISFGLYLGICLGYFVAMRELPNGLIWVGLFIGATFVSDTSGYAVGLLWGRRKAFPTVSPKKTVEGTLGALAGPAIVIGVLGPLLLQQPVWLSILLGVAVGIAATLGDLSVSYLKRQVGAKDSGQLLPGHGGLLDRLDSLLFTAIVVYYYIIWFAQPIR
ncbi:MAG: phosphatidate cytidylyltransferase [Chloroflexi bacterium]|nr:phosphatidate cytidylyltransferase [Chloroflexota bacterium]